MGSGSSGRSDSDSHCAQTSGGVGEGQGGGGAVALREEEKNETLTVTLVDIDPTVHGETKQGESATRAGDAIQVSEGRLGDIAARYREEAQAYKQGYVSGLAQGPSARVTLTS